MDDTLKDIVNQLAEKTKAGKVNWMIGNSANEYCLVLPESTLSISVYSNNYRVPMVECRVVNNRGDIILRENATQSSDEGDFLTGFFRLVRDAYTGKEEVIASIFSHIQNDETIGVSNVETAEESDLPF